MGQVESPRQLKLDLPPDEPKVSPSVPEKPVLIDGELRVHRLISFSQIEQIIYNDTEGMKPQGIFNANIAVGSAIGSFLTPGNFIWRYRGKYCFELNDYERKELRGAFSKFYPTGWGWQYYWDILMKHQPNFCDTENIMDSEHPHLEMRNIRDRLVPLWNDIAKKFKLDSLHLQSVAIEEGNSMVPSQKVALQESVGQIAQRIVKDRWHLLVDDDMNYSYISEPACLLLYKLNGQIFEIQVTPDYIKRLREKRKSVQKRQIAVKRMIGDYKDSAYRDIEDYSTPLGKTMLVYNWLLMQTGQNFKERGKRDEPTGLKIIRLPNRQVRRVFLISPDAKDPLDKEDVVNVLEFLREDGTNIFTAMPPLSPEDKEMAKSILEEALLTSQKSKLQ